jgi:pyruvate/2-oxoglutarate dehydrogenase complex dihydrolipoamide dehydrogenase (E3) component
MASVAAKCLDMACMMSKELLASAKLCMALAHIPARRLTLRNHQFNAWLAQVEAQVTNQVSARALQPNCLQAARGVAGW